MNSLESINNITLFEAKSSNIGNKKYSPSYLAKQDAADSVTFSGKNKQANKKSSTKTLIKTGIFATIIAKMLTLTGCETPNETKVEDPVPPAPIVETVQNGGGDGRPNVQGAPLVLQEDFTEAYEEGNISTTSADLSQTYTYTEYGSGKVESYTGYSDLESFINDKYGFDTLGAKIAAGKKIVDQNRNMISNINQYYLYTQANDYLEENLKNTDEADEMAGYVESMAYGDTTFQKLKEGNSLQGLSDDSQKLLEEIQGKIDTTGYEGGFKKYSADIKTEYINPNMIFGADYSDINEIFTPTVAILDQNDKTPAVYATSTLGYISLSDNLEVDLSECKTNEEKYTKVSDAILKNYMLDSFDSYSGVTVLSTISEANENNEIFNKTNENPSDCIQQIVNSEANGKVKFATPDASIPVISIYDATEQYFKEVLDNKLADGAESLHTAYLPVTQTLVSADNLEHDEAGKIPAKSLLAYVEYGDTSLLDAIKKAEEEGDIAKITSLRALGRTSLEQIFKNCDQLSGDWTDGADTGEVFEHNIAYVLEAAPDGKLMLEDIKFLVSANASEEAEPTE